jgi:hypothetical protein
MQAPLPSPGYELNYAFLVSGMVFCGGCCGLLRVLSQGGFELDRRRCKFSETNMYVHLKHFSKDLPQLEPSIVLTLVSPMLDHVGSHLARGT